jgi:uncharacterized membrane protein YhaH (DUF805 family)
MRRLHRAEGLGAAVLAFALPAAWLAPRLFLACWLTAWWYVLGLMLGAMANLWIHRLSGGRWGDVIRPVGLAAARRLPLALLLFLPVAAGLGRLYPWAGDPGWAAMIPRPAFASAWLQTDFFLLRMVLYALLWWRLSRAASLASAGRAAASLVMLSITGTLASVDLLMSLVPGWFSTAFGLVVMTGQALGGASLMVFWLARFAPASLEVHVAHRAPLARDLGNLLLMWSLTWAYVAFMEFIVIWAEDLPREIAWFVPRLQTGWWAVGVALVVLQLALPTFALLQRRLKDRPSCLSWIALGLVLSQLLNTAWLVLPSIDPHEPRALWLVPALALGMGLLVFGRLSDTVASLRAEDDPADGVSRPRHAGA